MYFLLDCNDVDMAEEVISVAILVDCDDVDMVEVIVWQETN